MTISGFQLLAPGVEEVLILVCVFEIDINFYSDVVAGEVQTVLHAAESRREAVPVLGLAFARIGEAMFFSESVDEVLKERLVPKRPFAVGFVGARRTDLGLSPIVREGDGLEIERGPGTVYLKHLDHHGVEFEVFACVLVEPIEGLAVFFSDRAGDPYDDTGVESGGVGDQLTQVGVVGGFELVLDDHHAIATQISSQEIEREATDGGLALQNLEFKTECFTEGFDVAL